MSFSICSTSGANTGVIQCDRRRAIPVKVIIGGKSFSSSEYATQSAVDTALGTAMKQPRGTASKLFPFPEITGITDKTDASKESTLGAFGPKVVLIEGKPGYEFDVIAGVSLEKKMRAFNGQAVPVFIYDNSGALWGKLDANNNFVGTPCLVYVTPHKFGDGANGQTTKISLSFVSASDLYDVAAFVQPSLGSSSLIGQVDGVLSEYSAHVSNVHKIQVKMSTSQPGQDLNLSSYFTTELATASGWQAFTGTSFTTPLAITSVAYNAAGPGWDITFDSTAYTALSVGTKISINLASPVTLAGLGVTEMEGVAVIATK